MTNLNFYFIRHGQTYFNKYDRMQGWSDTPLTEKGEQDARSCGEKIADVHFHNVYSSDLGRTIATASIIKSYNPSIVDHEVIQLKELRESFFGELEGEYNAVAWNRVVEASEYNSIEELITQGGNRLVQDYFAKLDIASEAEDYQKFSSRIYSGLEKIREANEDSVDKNILVVTHGNVIRTLAGYIDPKNQIIGEINNGSINIINYDGNSYNIDSINQ